MLPRSRAEPVRGGPDVPLHHRPGPAEPPVPEALSKLATKVLTNSTYVGISAAGHDPEFWGDCGRELTQRFITTKSVGDTSCAARRAGGWWVPGSFPTRVRDAPAAKQVDGLRATERQRRLATVAAWTVMDSVQHNFSVPGDSVGLRGGTVHFEQVGDEAVRWTLGDARFTDDVIVNGQWTGTGPDFDGELTLTGPGGRVRTMRISGQFLTDGADITITADVGGRPATFTVPAY